MRTISYVASEADAGRTVKGILRGELGVSSALLASLKPRGAVRLDGEAMIVTARVAAGQEVSITLEDEEGRFVAPESGPVNLVYEDEDVYVIDKDAPLPCQSSEKQLGGALENRLAARYGERFLFRPVNRLDKGTSGLMLAAKHAHAQKVMQSRLHTEEFVREYLAVTVGAPPEAEGVVDLPIGKADGATVRREVRADGKASITRYAVLLRADGMALVRLRLETGRTHQIRVHMAAIGCPLLGDFLYGEEDERLPGRVALHSHRLAFRHPITNAPLNFISPLPAAFSELLARFPGGGTRRG